MAATRSHLDLPTLPVRPQASGFAAQGLGVPDVVIQRILRHANVSKTTGYYIKTIADDVRGAMAKLETQIPELDTIWTPDLASTKAM